MKVNILLQEKGVAEITDEKSNCYDIIMSGLCFSELSNDEINFTLKETFRLLKPGGKLIVIDEVIPNNIFNKLLHLVIKIPVLVITYLLTQTTTKAVKNLPEKIKMANFNLEKVNYYFLGSLAIFISKKPEYTHEALFQHFQIYENSLFFP